jgi:cyclophilin family peptidyl-prolyl cis-trans isomerase
VENFLTYVREGHYDGTIFHRVIKNFMVQGGGYSVDYEQKPTHAPIPIEADNGLHNDRGTIAMARTSDPNSATAQFFINVVDNGFLNFKSKTHQGWGYAVFGKVIEGMDVVDEIRALPTGSEGPFSSDVPKTPVVIEKASVEEE